MVELVFIGMVYETIIIVFAVIVLVLVLKKYYERRHILTFLLFLVFLSWLCAIIFSWTAKILYLYSGIPYLGNDNISDPGTSSSFFLLRVADFRISFLFVTLANIFSYILEVKIFEKGYDNKRYAVYIVGAFTMFYSFFIYSKGNILLDVLAFFFVALYTLIVYIPFIIRSFQSYRSVVDPAFKKAFLSLGMMSIFIILIFVMLLLDRIMIFLGSPGYTIFYLLGWSFVIISFLGAYLGYIRPKSKET